jgi:V/A-type H+-transporting ATPase subunit I
MPWREVPRPVRMQRVALVAPVDALRDTLARVAVAGVVELDAVTDAEAPLPAGEA